MKYLIIILLFLFCTAAQAGLLISEIATATSGDDWVEIEYRQDVKSSIDVSRLYVTMYYGTNEPLATEPVTLYSYNRPETPYDDRFLVVHLTRPGIPDETDLTGDTDRDGHLDVYCNNYFASLWNAEGVVAIDTDDDPSNGMIDFAGWSDNDGDPSDTILGYVTQAVNHAQWTANGAVTQQCCISMPPNGIKSYQSIVRIGSDDTNRSSDFVVTQVQTPGGINIVRNEEASNELFRIDNKSVIARRGDPLRKAECTMYVDMFCHLRMRVFSEIGMLVYDSGLIRDVAPGRFAIPWKGFESARTGLYIVRIDGTDSRTHRSSSKKITIIVTRY
jgi:hypothetical protein